VLNVNRVIRLNSGWVPRWLVFFAILFLSACGSSSNNSDLRQFISEVSAKPRGNIPAIPQFEAYEPYKYGAANQRSPFEPPVVIVDRGRSNITTQIRPPADHVKQPLELFNIASLVMVGTLARNQTQWGLVLDQEGVVHRVQVGDYMGTQWGKIKGIRESGIDLEEIVSDGAGGWLPRARSIEMLGGN
jgi:type IV pilus assembly protein PilP